MRSKELQHPKYEPFKTLIMMKKKKQIENRIRSLLSVLILLFLGSLPAQAQFATAAAYPFVPSSKTYVPLSSSATDVTPAGIDDGYTTFPIGFNFNFCGTTHTQVTAHTNGYLSFGTVTTMYLTSSQAALGTIAPCVFAQWGGDPSGKAPASIKYEVEGTAPNRILTVQYTNWGHYSQAAPMVNYQYKLYEAGPIELIYEGIGTGTFNSGVAIGIANSSSDFQTLSDTGPNPTSSSVTFNNSIGGTKPADGQSYLWGAVPCSGTPETRVLGPDQACIYKPFTLSLEGVTLYLNLEFQWQESANGTTWTDMVNATSHTMTTSISAPRWFRAKVTCSNSGLSFTTAAKYVSIAPFYYCYCDGSRALSNEGTDIGHVGMVALPSGEVKLSEGNPYPVLNNPEAKHSYSEKRYTVPPIVVYRDSSYALSVSQISSSAFTPATAAVYIDFNRNGRFDTSERVLLRPTVYVLPEPGVVRDTFRVPQDAEIGLTGMRVILSNGSVDPDTCLTYSVGETEDYLVDIRYEPCIGPVDPGRIALTDSSICPGYHYSMFDTTHEFKKSNMSWDWETSPDSVNWIPMANSQNQDSFMNILFQNTVYHRVRAVCATTGDTTYSAGAKVARKPAYKCYCISRSLGGDLDSSDIGAFGFGPFLLSTGGPHTANDLASRRRTDYTDEGPIELFTGKGYEVLIYHTMPGWHHADARVTLFIDFNNNRQYDLPQERVGTWFSSINDYLITDTIYIPDSVITGVETGVRVILNNNVGPNSPSDDACGEYVSGETEDFMVVFKREFPKSVEKISDIRHVRVYPNPGTGKYFLEFETRQSSRLDWKIRSVTGQTLKQSQKEVPNGRVKEVLDISGFTPGVYILEWELDGKKQNHRLILQ